MRAATRRHDERGAVAVIVALSLTSLLIVGGMVLDFGIVRVDRQVDKAAADAAVSSGLQGLISDNKNYPARGVCSALQFLQQNAVRFADANAADGTWTDGNGASAPNGCTDLPRRSVACSPTDKSTWTKLVWDGAYGGSQLHVTVQSGYVTSSTDGFAEDSLPAAINDNDDGMSGCNQLAVTITQHRKPGLGSLASSSDLVSTVRSVGRVRSSPIGDAPAMLLLKRTGCPVLLTGSAAGTSYIHVYGAVSSNGRTQPGSIHADTDGTGCSGSIFQGRGTNGVVSYAAPLASNPLLPDPNRPGQITSVAGYNGVGMGTVRDAAGQVYGSAGLNEAQVGSPAKNEPTGRALVTRGLVDARYLAGVRNAVSGAQSNVFGLLTAANASSYGYTVVSGCSPSGTITAAKVYIDCTANNGYTGSAVINSTTVVFAGKVNPSSPISMPYAHHVYVFGSSGDAFSLGNTFSMHTNGNTNADGSCSTGFSASKAVLFVKNGDFKESNGGLLQLCKTTVFMMGGQPNGCLPTTNGTSPTQTPCGTTMGTGQFSQTGGNVDWTAPNQYDVMTTGNGDPDPLLAPAWSDVNGPEDLALWSESAGNTSSTTYSMNGSGTLHTTGVFMVPNADSFSIGGSGQQDLTNAQYIATSIALNGSNTRITMRVDPNSAVQLPRNTPVGLVR